MKNLIVTLIAIFISINAYSQGVNEVTLVVGGMAETKEDATNIALRSAVEQAFGVFVSANTTIFNDELVKDEIATVSSGNVSSYKELNSIVMPNGHYSVSLEVVVSTQKLVAYAKSKGSSCEFAGATLMANRKLMELNKINTEKAFDNLLVQLESLAPFIFDHNLVLGDPSLDNDYYLFPVKLKVLSNENTVAFINLLNSTMDALKLSSKKAAEVDRILGSVSRTWVRGEEEYFYSHFPGNKIEMIITLARDNFILESNLGHKFNMPAGEFWCPASGQNNQVLNLLLLYNDANDANLFKKFKKEEDNEVVEVYYSSNKYSHTRTFNIRIPVKDVNNLTNIEVKNKYNLSSFSERNLLSLAENLSLKGCAYDERILLNKDGMYFVRIMVEDGNSNGNQLIYKKPDIIRQEIIDVDSQIDRKISEDKLNFYINLLTSDEGFSAWNKMFLISDYSLLSYTTTSADNKKVTIEIYDFDYRIWFVYQVERIAKNFGYELRNSFIH